MIDFTFIDSKQICINYCESAYSYLVSLLFAGVFLRMEWRRRLVWPVNEQANLVDAVKQMLHCAAFRLAVQPR
jgi:hypothetical protein